jgi:eukaryotic-like serine/threonine-protein kinase
MSSSVWDKLRRLVGRAPLVVPDDVSSTPAIEGPREPTPRGAAEAWLADLVARLAAGQSGAVRELAAPELGKKIDVLVETGHPRLAAEWLDKLATAAPAGVAADDVRARAAKIYLERGDFGEALPHLQTLAASPSHAAHAHFHLGEHFQRQGDRERALRHFEAVLAVDVDYPNARARAHALRATRGAAAPAATVTIAGVDGHAATTGARYRLVAELGRGASGAVYRAQDIELEREVAIKLLHAHLRGNMGRFFAEARVAAALRHPHVVAVLDLDEEHGRIVMELATGGTLRERLQSGPLPLLEALELHAALLSALAAAHRRGIVHRDVKPANLLYRRPGGEVVLGDFGVAHLGAATTSEAVGTLFYMAPEQRRGVITPAVDVWAAGVILHQALTGRAPSGLAGAPVLALPSGLVAAELAQPVAEHLAALTAVVPEERPAVATAAASAAALRERARAGDAPARFAAAITGRLSG